MQLGLDLPFPQGQAEKGLTQQQRRAGQVRAIAAQAQEVQAQTALQAGQAEPPEDPLFPLQQ